MYGFGLAAVYLIFVLMYAHAYRRRETLELNELEVFITRRSMIDHAAMMTIGLISSLLALTLPLRIAGISGMVCWLIPAYFTIAGRILGRRQERMAKTMSASV